MQRFKRKNHLLVFFLTLIICGWMGNAYAVITPPPSIVVPQNGNVGDIIWESVPATVNTNIKPTRSSVMRIQSYVFLRHIIHNASGRSFKIADGLVLAVKGEIWMMSGNSHNARALKTDYLSAAVYNGTDSAGTVDYLNDTVIFGVDNHNMFTAGVWSPGSNVVTTRLRIALLRTEKHIPPGEYDIPPVEAMARYWAEGNDPTVVGQSYSVYEGVMNSGHITVLGRTCSMSVSNTHIDFGTMQRQSSSDSDLGGGKYSDVTASCTGGTTEDAKQKVRIKFAGGDADNVPTNMAGVVIRGSLSEQSCSVKAGWLPMNDTQWSELSTLAAGATAVARSRINWKVCQTLSDIDTGAFNASVNYRMTIY